MNIKKLLSNKILIYLTSRYLTYGLQFMLSLVIAVRLGPYYLGVYGLVQLILSYFAQVNFGIPHSLNVLLVHNKSDKDIQNKYTLNSYALYTYQGIIIVVVAVFMFFMGGYDSENYKIEQYIPLIIIIAILKYYITLISTVVRFRNQVNILSLLGTLPVVMDLVIVWFYEGESLVYGLVVVNLISSVMSTIIGYYKKALPVFSIRDFSFDFQYSIIHKGLYLFLYNSCFYFILIAVRTIVSSNYSVEEFGYFTFSYTIANAVMLLLDSINTIIFPKTIDLLSSQNNEEKMAVLNKLRVGYITTSHLLVYLAMALFPLFIMFFPRYSPALSSMNMISLAILMNTNGYGYKTLLIAENREKIASRISVEALLITVIVGLILVNIFHVAFSFVIISMLIAYLFLSFFATLEGNKIIVGESNLKSTVMNFFPLRLLIPYLIALAISVLEYEFIIFLPFVLFVIFNFRDIIYLKKIVDKMVKAPNVIDI